MAVLRRQVDQAPPVIPGVAPELWDRISWMLAKDPGSRPASAAEAYAALAPLESSLASRPALAPWSGPETATPIRTGIPADQAYLPTHGGPAAYDTVLRHRDRGELAAPGGAGEGTPQSVVGGPPADPQVPLTSPPSRRRRQARIAALAVAVITVIGLVTGVALAATHRPASLRPTADSRTTASRAPVSPAAVQPTPTPATSAPDSSPAPETASAPDVLPSAGTQPAPQLSVITQTVTDPPPPSASPSPSPSPSPSSTTSLSAAEEQLVNMLNSSVLDNCTSRPEGEGGDVLAAVNCSAVRSGPTLRPLAETLTAGSAETWFQNVTSSFTSNDNCPGGEYVGTWQSGSTVEGQLGCGLQSNGLYRIVWIVDGDIGLIADGSNGQSLYSWWKASACQVVNGC